MENVCVFRNFLLFEGVFVERLKVRIIVKIYRVEGLLKSKGFKNYDNFFIFGMLKLLMVFWLFWEFFVYNKYFFVLRIFYCRLRKLLGE